MSPGPVLVLKDGGPSPIRARIGALLADATSADFAVGRIRLAALDLTAAELGVVERCRVLLGHLDAATLLDAAEGGPPAAAERLAVLAGFAASGRLEVRAAGMAGWTPDFSVIRPSTGPVALLGAHYFSAPSPIVGPSFTAVVEDHGAVRLLSERYEELWALGHDVLPAIRDVVERAHALALGAARPGGGDDRPDPAP